MHIYIYNLNKKESFRCINVMQTHVKFGCMWWLHTTRQVNGLSMDLVANSFGLVSHTTTSIELLYLLQEAWYDGQIIIKLIKRKTKFLQIKNKKIKK